MADISLMGLGSPIIQVFVNMFKWISYLLPVFVVFGLAAFGYFYMTKRKRFNIDALIITETADNKVIGYDKAGVIKNMAGGQSLALRYRKKTFPIPDRKFWILNEKGRFTIPFYKYGEDDYAPIETEITDHDMNNPVKKSLRKKILAKLKDIKEIDLEKFKESSEYQAIDVRNALKDVKLTPIPSDIKTHLKLSTKESILKWHKAKPYEKLLTLAPYAMAGLLIFLTMFYGYKFAESQISKSYEKSNVCIKQAERTLELVNEKCIGIRPASPESIPSPPI